MIGGGALAAALLVAASACGWGRLLLPRIAAYTTWGPAERLVVSWALGAVLLETAATALGVVGLLRAWAIAAVVVPGAANAAAALVRGLRGRGAPPLPGPLDGTILAVGLLSALAGLLASAAPIVFYDSLTVHAFLPDLWAQAGRITLSPWSWAMTNMAGAHALYVLARLLGPGESMQVLHAAAGLVALLGTGVLGARLAGDVAAGADRAGRIAFLLAATCPVVILLFHLLMVDLVEAAAAVAFLLVLLRLLEGERVLTLGALLFGGAVAVKYPAAIWWPLAVGACAVARGPRAAVRLGAALTAGCAVAAPWLVRNALSKGNPVYPFFTAPQAYLREVSPVPASAGAYLRGLAAMLGAEPLRDLSVGLLFVAVLPGLALAARRLTPSGRALAGAAIVGLLLWGGGGRVLWSAARFYLPGYLLLCAAASAGLTRTRWGAPLALLVALTNAALAWGHVAPLTRALPAAMGLLPRTVYVRAHDPGYPVRRAAAGLRLLAVGPRGYGLGPGAVVPFTYDSDAADRYFTVASAAEAAARLRADGLTHLLVDLPDLRRLRRDSAFAACDPASGPFAEALRTWPLIARAPGDRALLYRVPVTPP